MNIYVGNIAYSTSEDTLKAHFETIGKVGQVKIIHDRNTGRSKGFGFVTMDNEEEGRRAISELNGVSLDNRELMVNEAHEKKEKNK